MRPAGSRRRLVVVVAIIMAAGLLALIVQRQRHSTQFRIGSAVDDVWSYIHTEAVSDADGFSGGIVPIDKQTRWIADTTTIQSETRFIWRKKPFVIQKTVYSYRNGTITDANSNWELKWPF